MYFCQIFVLTFCFIWLLLTHSLVYLFSWYFVGRVNNVKEFNNDWCDKNKRIRSFTCQSSCYSSVKRRSFTLTTMTKANRNCRTFNNVPIAWPLATYKDDIVAFILAVIGVQFLWSFEEAILQPAAHCVLIASTETNQYGIATIQLRYLWMYWKVVDRQMNVVVNWLIIFMRNYFKKKGMGCINRA